MHLFICDISYKNHAGMSATMYSLVLSVGTGIRRLPTGLATLLQGLVVKDNVGRPQVSLG